MVRSITMAHRHPCDREPPPEDREQAYAKMKADISNAWTGDCKGVKARPAQCRMESPSSGITESRAK